MSDGDWFYAGLREALSEGRLEPVHRASERCPKCTAFLPQHWPYCSDADISDVRRGLTTAAGAQQTLKSAMLRHKANAEFWQAKFHTLRIENNALRRKVERAVMEES